MFKNAFNPETWIKEMKQSSLTRKLPFGELLIGERAGRDTVKTSKEKGCLKLVVLSSKSFCLTFRGMPSFGQPWFLYREIN